MLLGYKIAGFSIVALLGVIGFISYKHVVLERDYALQNATIVELEQHNATLTSVNERQLETIDQLTTLTQRQADLLVEYGEQNNDAFARANRLENTLNTLRQTEAVKALEEPYARGNAASMRVGELLRAIAGTSGREGENHPDTP